MRNKYLMWAKNTPHRMHKLEKDPQKRRDLDDVMRDIDKGVFLYEEWIQEAKMIGIRNPAFDGDMVGWLDDDFDDDEEKDGGRDK